MSTLEKFHKFIKDPTEKTVKNLDEYMYNMLYTFSTFCLREKKGNLEVAKKIRKLVLPYVQMVICLDRRGLRSLFLSLWLLANLSKTTVVNIYMTKNKRELERKLKKQYGEEEPDFKIEHDRILTNQYKVTQQYEKLGAEKIYAFYMEGVKDYFTEIFKLDSDLMVEKITITSEGKVYPFYEIDMGIVWGDVNKECRECTYKMLKGKYIDSDCKELLDNKCYENFRHRPRNIEPQKEVEFKRVDITKKREGWECQHCTLQNAEDSKKCISCGKRRGHVCTEKCTESGITIY